MTKAIRLIGVLLLLVIAMSSYSSALGVTPARRVVNFEPGKTIGYEFNIINSEAEDQIIAIYPVGAFEEYVSLERNFIRVSKDETKVPVRLDLNMPEDFEPGTAKTNILIAKLPNDAGIKDDAQGEIFSGNLDSNVGASIVVAHQLWVEVPYPGKFVKAQLRNQEFDGKPEFIVSLFNLGTETINEANARIEVLSGTYEELTELKTNTVGLSSGNEGKISAVWEDANINPGVYRARAVVNYDGKTVVLEENVYIGSSEIDIKDLSVNNFRLGTIAKMNLLVESNWNQPITDVFGEFSVERNGQEVGNFLTAPIEIAPYAEETLVGYWDTEGFEVGTYDVIVQLNYQGKVEERIFETVVAVDEIKIGTGLASGQVTDSGESGSQLTLIILLMVVLVGLNIGLFLYIRRSKK